MSRIRSPNYPAFSLSTAIDRARVILAAEGKNPAPREALAKHIGFGTLNGASASALSAIAKYGLLEPAGDGEAKLTDLAMRILYPHDEGEKRAALQEAAFKPALFSEINEKWPDRPPSDESLRSFLVRKGFSQGALDQVIQFYRETIEVARVRNGAHDSSPEPQQHREAKVHHHHPHETAAPRPQSTVLQPVVGDKPFTVAFDGSVLTGTMHLRTVKDIERLVKVLEAQKAAIEAMQEDPRDPDLAHDAWQEEQLLRDRDGEQ